MPSIAKCADPCFRVRLISGVDSSTTTVINDVVCGEAPFELNNSSPSATLKGQIKRSKKGVKWKGTGQFYSTTQQWDHFFQPGKLYYHAFGFSSIIHMFGVQVDNTEQSRVESDKSLTPGASAADSTPNHGVELDPSQKILFQNIESLPLVLGMRSAALCYALILGSRQPLVMKPTSK